MQILDDKENIKRLVIVAYRLPFTFKSRNNKTTAVQNTGGLVSAILSLTQKIKIKVKDGSFTKTVWVGKGDYSEKELLSVNEVNESFELKPVQIPENVNDKFYGGFCNDLIWPLFHYFPSMAVFGEDYFENYQIANRLFFNELAKVIQPGDFVWIHDYQLFLLPQMVRDEFPDVSISFFLHIPFPSYEIFRIMPDGYQTAILKGLLGANLIGFHTYDYAQHFLKSVKRRLGYDVILNTVNSGATFSRADAFPISIDYNKFHNAVDQPQTEKYISKIRTQKRDRKIILSVDRLDYTKGFLNRLAAFELFLGRYSNMRGRVIFNMVMVPSRDTIARYQDMKKEIEATVGRINGKYGTLDWNPIIYQYRSLKFNELVALYSQSDVGLLTSLRDGMNLVAKEYVAAQHYPHGMLVLSELAGAAAEMGESILINPSDTSGMADAIYIALNMTLEEKADRIEKMAQRLKEYDVFSWADDILRSTLKVRDDQKSYGVRLVSKSIEDDLIKSFREAANPILFFDYDGTLVPIKQFPELAIPDGKIISITERLSAQTNVVIISGRNKDFLDKWFAYLDLTLIAEHGAFIKYPGKDWEYVLDNHDSWKEVILPVLTRYANRCKGAFVEQKTASLCWHYRNADADLSALRAIELKNELTELISNMPLQIIEGQKVVEVKRAGYDKGSAAKSVFDEEKHDFILAIGDDKTDEDLFSALPEKAITIKVGKETTRAKYSFTMQSAVIDFLEKLLSSLEKG
ncbi:MAG TPA: bifunctional alpha,alpha-trehalose-phosphate synthase (UDP-forming)/trehalose-phosphatase [Bacteroidales bacterium]|nr:bifunctional alpha,alpha-trehalose-phosphate synthase (UDP-forming)/trehalose-phosphatase [Bacteroidales bacterium]